MKKFSKLMAALLALVLCLSLLPMAAFAAEGNKCQRIGCDGTLISVPEEAPTCQKEGVKGHLTCNKCGTNYHRGIVPVIYAGPVDRIDKVDCDYSVPATCVSSATCKWCGAEDPNGQPDPNNHAEGCTLSSTWAINVNEHYKQYSLCGTKVSHAPCEVGVTAVPATCQHAGTTAGTKCSTCDTILSGVTVDPQKEHSYTSGKYVVNGTGHAETCVYGCGAHGSFAAHTGAWEVTKAATCTEEGVETRVCDVCKREDTRPIKMIDHKDENGDGKCDDCDTDLTCQHEWTVQNTYEATCTTIGYKVEYCAKCKTSQTIKTADKLNHDFRDTADTVDTATCTQAGEKTQYCSRCDATQTVETEVLGHKYGEFIAEVPATCLEDGMQGHYECERCHRLFTNGTQDYSAEELVIAAPGHTPGDPVTENLVPATETEDGSYDEVVYCEVCAEEISRVRRTIDATGTGGEEIEPPDVPLVDGTEIDEPEVPLAGLMTRAEFVNYLYVQAGSPEAQAPTFTDVPEDYEYAAAIGWAQANGIAKGITEDEFAPDEIVSVEQATLFLVRYAQFSGVEMPELAALAGKDPLEILDNADEVLAEFFEAILPKPQAA